MQAVAEAEAAAAAAMAIRTTAASTTTAGGRPQTRTTPLPTTTARVLTGQGLDLDAVGQCRRAVAVDIRLVEVSRRLDRDEEIPAVDQDLWSARLLRIP